jgi:hypothetical protein
MAHSGMTRFLHIVDDLADAPVEKRAERFALQLNDTHP